MSAFDLSHCIDSVVIVKRNDLDRDRHEIFPPFGYVSVLVADNCRCKSSKM